MIQRAVYSAVQYLGFIWSVDLKRDLAWFRIFSSLVFTHIAAGVHDRSTTNTVIMKSSPHIYCHVESLG